MDGLAAGCQAPVLASAPTDATRPFSPGVWLRMQLLEQSGRFHELIIVKCWAHRQLHVCAHKHSQGHLGCRSMKHWGQDPPEPHTEKKWEVKTRRLGTAGTVCSETFTENCSLFTQNRDNDTILQFSSGGIIIEEADLQQIYSSGRRRFFRTITGALSDSVPVNYVCLRK